MIQRTLPTWQRRSWQEQLIDTIRDLDELCEFLGLRREQVAMPAAAATAAQSFALKVPRQFAQRMHKGDPNDPLLLQVLPSAEELSIHPGFALDPLREQMAGQPGMIQKYHNRVLLMVSGACAVHCRYCFRRHFPYSDHRRSKNQWRQTLAQLAENPNINEVILSGGDPLSANDRLLAGLVAQINQISHITTLRIHTRLPVVIPERLDARCLDWLGEHPRLNKVLVLHCNHANEISPELANAVQRLRQLNIHVLNQSVLLKGINDSVEALVTLSEKLFNAGIMPYYLHLLDKVRGTHHFEVSEPQARRLHGEMRAQLPGYLVPKLVREIPGEPSKTVLT